MPNPKRRHSQQRGAKRRTHYKAEKVTLSKEHQAYAWVTAEQLEKYADSIESEIKRAIMIAAG